MLAIIIPYYKLTFFEKTLQSISNQTDKRFNVYIGSDASPEDCSSLLKKFEKRINFTYHCFEKNLGGTNLTEQWDRCIDMSKKEEWLMILGDDDVLKENVVSEFYKNIDEVIKKEYNIIHFATEVIDEKGKTFLGPYLHPKQESVANLYCRKIQGVTRSSLSEYIFKKVAYQKYHFINYPLAWHSDDKFWLDISDNKYIYTINSAIVYIRLSDINISGRQDNLEKKLEASFMFLKDILKSNSTLFNKTQILLLLMSFEILIKKTRKLTKSEWLFLFKYYLRYFRVTSFLKFKRRFIISFLTKI
jgi:glycosyltransferase involved in cell wall biosynthesis